MIDKNQMIRCMMEAPGLHYKNTVKISNKSPNGNSLSYGILMRSTPNNDIYIIHLSAIGDEYWNTWEATSTNSMYEAVGVMESKLNGDDEAILAFEDLLDKFLDNTIYGTHYL